MDNFREVRWTEGHTSRQILRKQFEHKDRYTRKVLAEVFGEELYHALLKLSIIYK